MKIKIEINMDNAAFEDNPNELTEILANIGNRVGWHNLKEGTVRDSNGNVVGTYKVTGR